MRSALIFLFFALTTSVFGQRNEADSLHIALKKEKTDTGKAIILYNLSYAYQLYRPDSALMFAQQAYDLSVKRRFLKGEAWSLGQMANAFREMGNNAQALNYYLQQLKIEEERGYADNLATVNMTIALLYNRDADTANAIHYILKADSIIAANNFTDLEMYGLLNTGDIFEKAGRLKEALYYTQKSYQLAVKTGDGVMIGSSLSNMGNIFAKTGSYANAVSSYRQSVPFLTAAGDSKSLAESELGLANVFYRTMQPDSALFYAGSAYSISSEKGFLKNAIAAGTLLSKLYKAQQRTDSAFAYQEIVLQLKDSIEGAEKIKQVAGMSIAEKIRQQHIAALQQEEKEEMRQKLQLLAIGIMIPIFFLVTMYISRRKVNKKVIEFAGIVSLLLLFEYITLFIHPFVAQITHHSPLLEIIIFVCIAALLLPAHHRIEHWFTKRLTTMNEMHMQKTKIKLSTPVAEETLEEESTFGIEHSVIENIEDIPEAAEIKEAGHTEEDAAEPAPKENKD